MKEGVGQKQNLPFPVHTIGLLEKKKKVYLVEVNWETCAPWEKCPKILLADTSKILLENQQYYYQLGEWACMEDFTFGYWYGPVEKPKGMR